MKPMVLNAYQSEEIDISSDEDNDIEWKINPKQEKIFWNKIVLPNLIYPPSLCQKFKKKTFSIHESLTDEIINPYYLTCINKACKNKRNIRHYLEACQLLQFMKYL